MCMGVEASLYQHADCCLWVRSGRLEVQTSSRGCLVQGWIARQR